MIEKLMSIIIWNGEYFKFTMHSTFMQKKSSAFNLRLTWCYCLFSSFRRRFFVVVIKQYFMNLYCLCCKFLFLLSKQLNRNYEVTKMRWKVFAFTRRYRKTKTQDSRESNKQESERSRECFERPRTICTSCIHTHLLLAYVHRTTHNKNYAVALAEYREYCLNCPNEEDEERKKKLFCSLNVTLRYNTNKTFNFVPLQKINMHNKKNLLEWTECTRHMTQAQHTHL